MYVLRRLIEAAALTIGATIITFVIIHLAPGDPISYLTDQGGSVQFYQSVRQHYGLDLPIYQQLLLYLTAVLHGDLGTSFRYGGSVLGVIFERVPATLLLMLTATAISSVVGVVSGVLAARKPFSFTDKFVVATSAAAYSIPTFFLGQILLLVLGFYLDWFPIQGMETLGAANTGLQRAYDILWHLALPALTLAALQTAIVSRITRASMIEKLNEDFIVTAKMKGLRERVVLVRHALRNALLPITTVVGSNLGYLLTGAVLVENVFAWPGLGRLLFDAIVARDYPLVGGMFIFISVSVVLVNLAVDLFYVVLDPRIRYT